MNPSHEKKPRSNRRRFLATAVKTSIVSGLGVLGYTLGVEPHWVEVASRKLPIVGLPAHLEGRTAVQISDLHVGETLDLEYMRGVLADLRKLSPDMILVTGDFMTCYYNEQVASTLDTMQLLPSTPLGNFAILGNHDYGRMWRQKGPADELAGGLTELGIRVLRNEVAEVEGLQLAGVDDLQSGRCRIPTTLAQLDPDKPAITLCHNPDAADMPGWDRFRGWILAGHTHGGQCKPPLLAPPVTPVNNKRYTSGAFQLSGGRQMYINRGLGYVLRARFNCRPEVTLFHLERAATV